MELFKAHQQWASRPDDERFNNLQELHDACKKYASQAQAKSMAVADLRTEANGHDVCIVGKSGNPAQIGHWAFGQLAARVGAPASYLRELPPTLACQNLNYGLANLADKTDTAQLLFHKNGGLLLRAFTSDKYTRIWNWEVAERLLELQQRGWSPATPDFNTTGDDKPALYASDHDLFAFVRNNSVTIAEPGNPDGLQRGVIVENSEVGASALKLTRFLYRRMCGNHIIWGASRVLEISVRHAGEARQRWGEYQVELNRYLQASAKDEEASIARAKTLRIAGGKDAVLDKLFGMRNLNLSRKTLEASYNLTDLHMDTDGDPRTVWGMVQGITRFSQQTPYADARNVLDRAAGKLMEANF